MTDGPTDAEVATAAIKAAVEDAIDAIEAGEADGVDPEVLDGFAPGVGAKLFGGRGYVTVNVKEE